MSETFDRNDDDRDAASKDMNTPAGSAHRRAARDFFQRVRTECAGTVTETYLFGSVARDDPTPTSDVDVLVVVAADADADYAAVDDTLLEIAYDVQLEHGIPIEVHSIREPEFDARQAENDPFIRTVLAEGESHG